LLFPFPEFLFFLQTRIYILFLLYCSEITKSNAASFTFSSLFIRTSAYLQHSVLRSIVSRPPRQPALISSSDSRTANSITSSINTEGGKVQVRVLEFIPLRSRRLIDFSSGRFQLGGEFSDIDPSIPRFLAFLARSRS